MSKTQEDLTQGAVAAAGGLVNPDDTGFGVSGPFGPLRGLFPGVEDEQTPQMVTAVQAVKAVEKKTASAQQIASILEAANIDIQNPLTQVWLSGIALGATGPDAAKVQLATLSGPGGGDFIAAFIERFPEALIIPVTPYSQALEENAFAPTLPLPPPSEAEIARREPAGPMGRTGYEYSDATGAIRYANGTIVTADGGIIFDPSRSAPGSSQWFRKVSETWGPEEIRRQKDKMVAYGYLPKDDAKGDEFTVEFRRALETYWTNFYVNGKPIRSAQAAGGRQLPPLIDYKDFQAQITNDMRDQLRRVLGTEPTEDQVRAQAQYVMRTAADLQKTFRRKEYGSFASQALTEATEKGIGALETSPYAQDVLENTKLADSLQNAAYVTRSLMS